MGRTLIDVFKEEFQSETQEYYVSTCEKSHKIFDNFQRSLYTNYLITESEVITAKSQTEALPY